MTVKDIFFLFWILNSLLVYSKFQIFLFRKKNSIERNVLNVGFKLNLPIISTAILLLRDVTYIDFVIILPFDKAIL
jgi:hypothetical protein